jgi:hypothetical protein
MRRVMSAASAGVLSPVTMVPTMLATKSGARASRRVYGEIDRAAWQAEFRSICYGRRGLARVRAVVEQIRDALPVVIKRVEAEGEDAASMQSIFGGIQQRVEACRRQLG